MRYRRSVAEELWHACLNCSGWPHLSFVETDEERYAYPRCVVCEMKQEVGTCKSQD